MFLIILWQPINFVICKIRGTRWIHGFDNRIVTHRIMRNNYLSRGLKNDEDRYNWRWHDEYTRMKKYPVTPSFRITRDHCTSGRRSLVSLTCNPISIFFHWPIREVFFGWNFIRFCTYFSVLFMISWGFYPLINYDKSPFTWRFYLAASFDIVTCNF